MQRWAPDLNSDPVHRLAGQVPLPLPHRPGRAASTPIGGMPWLVWGCFVRSVLVLHTTWLVNSATHVWGYRTHQTRDNSTNLWWVALLTYGEGWHNNHHAFQTSARHGMRWWEIDMTYMALRLMSMVGLVHSLKLPKPRHRPAAPAGRRPDRGRPDRRRDRTGRRRSTEPMPTGAVGKRSLFGRRRGGPSRLPLAVAASRTGMMVLWKRP